jgi:hypothetical protein
MPDRRLYTVSVPEHAQTRDEQSASRNLSDLAAVAGGSGSVTALGTDAQQRDLRVQYKGYNDALLARMFHELADSDTIETVPFFGVNPDGSHAYTPQDGYYSVSSADYTTPDDRSSSFPTVEATITRVGTRKQHWRHLGTRPAAVDNKWGSDQTQEVGIPAATTRARWYDGDALSTAAEPHRTASTEFGGVDIYRAADAPYDTLELLYELPYPEEGKVDLAVYDTRGSDTRTTTVDGQTILEWQRVFATDHEYDGVVVVSNSRRRLTLDDTNPGNDGGITYEKHTPDAGGYGVNYGEAYGLSDSSGGWDPVDLYDNRAWVLDDVDLTTIDYARVSARLGFRSTVSDREYELNMHLARGADGVIFYEPEDRAGRQGPLPTDLEIWLDKIASERTFVLGENQTVVKREEVRA